MESLQGHIGVENGPFPPKRRPLLYTPLRSQVRFLEVGQEVGLFGVVEMRLYLDQISPEFLLIAGAETMRSSIRNIFRPPQAEAKRITVNPPISPRG